MRSPFPGMDPYLEARWSSFHVLMIGAVAATLKRVLPAGLQARPEEVVRIETRAEARAKKRSPDVAIVEAGGRASPTPPAPRAGVAPGAAVAERIRIAYPRDPVTLRRVDIVDRLRHDRVVTSIEILSPSNKAAGPLNDAYRKKLRTCEAAGVNWVEIDLLRSRRTHLPVRWNDLPKENRADCLALTYRADDGEVEAYPIRLRSRLPVIDVPLRFDDDPAPLDLQAAFDRVWDDGPFDDIDYSEPCDPPLSPENAAWLADRLAQRAAS